MAQVLVRGVAEAAIARLKARAAANSRSLEAELRGVIEDAARFDLAFAETRDVAARLRRRLAGRKHPDSVNSLAEDRRR